MPLNRPDRGRRFEPRPGSTFRGPTRALWAAFLLAMMSLAAGGEATAIETLGYRTVREEGPFEIRRVEPHIVAATFVEGDFDDVGTVGFRRLFEYISGLNRSEAEIAMTAPVTRLRRTQRSSAGDPSRRKARTVDSGSPSSCPPSTLETLPVPADERIVLKAESPERSRPSAIPASGRVHAIERTSTSCGTGSRFGVWRPSASRSGRYDPPFMPWFLRRNEILITVREP